MVGVVVVVVIDDVNGLEGLLLDGRAAKDVRVGLLVGVDGERPGEREAEGGYDGTVGPEDTENGKEKGEEGEEAGHVTLAACGGVGEVARVVGSHQEDVLSGGDAVRDSWR